MEREAFLKIQAAGQLTWEERNPIGYVYYPSSNTETNATKASENTNQQPTTTEQRASQVK